MRAFYPNTETIIFAEHFGSDGIAKGEAGYDQKCDELRGFVFEPIRAYLASEWEAAGLTAKDLNECTQSQMSGHYFTRTQWALPTAEKYKLMQERANEHLSREYEDLRREYEDLRREYEDLRREYEDLRRPFNATESRPYTDVWDFKTVQDYPGKHPCEKPLQMIEHIIQTSSREGAMVLDCFAGSGVVGRACRSFKREAILCEVDRRWYDRMTQELSQGRMF